MSLNVLFIGNRLKLDSSFFQDEVYEKLVFSGNVDSVHLAFIEMSTIQAVLLVDFSYTDERTQDVDNLTLFFPVDLIDEFISDDRALQLISYVFTCETVSQEWDNDFIQSIYFFESGGLTHVVNPK